MLLSLMLLFVGTCQTLGSVSLSRFLFLHLFMTMSALSCGLRHLPCGIQDLSLWPTLPSRSDSRAPERADSAVTVHRLSSYGAQELRSADSGVTRAQTQQSQRRLRSLWCADSGVIVRRLSSYRAQAQELRCADSGVTRVQTQQSQCTDSGVYGAQIQELQCGDSVVTVHKLRS